MSDQIALDLDTITVHCFTCPHTVERATPSGAHDAMEEHYRAKHGRLISRIVAGLS